MTFSPEDFRAETDVSHETLDRLKSYAALLSKWQARINLVGRATLPDMWRRHFLDSAQILPLVRGARPDLFRGGSGPNWLDMGSGAGFPGLVIAIMALENNGGHVHLVESNQRKCAFLRQVIRDTDAPATVHCCRVEDMSPPPVDVVTSRALAPLDKLIEMAAPLIAKDGEMWYLKGQDVEKELTQATISWNMRDERHPSRSDKTGTILRLRGIERVDKNKD